MKTILNKLIGTKVAVFTSPNDNPMITVCGILKSLRYAGVDCYSVANYRDYPNTHNYCMSVVRFSSELVGSIIEGSMPNIILMSNEKSS